MNFQHVIVSLQDHSSHFSRVAATVISVRLLLSTCPQRSPWTMIHLSRYVLYNIFNPIRSKGNTTRDAHPGSSNTSDISYLDFPSCAVPCWDYGPDLDSAIQPSFSFNQSRPASAPSPHPIPKRRRS